jgi:HEAT repeat protein
MTSLAVLALFCASAAAAQSASPAADPAALERQVAEILEQTAGPEGRQQARDRLVDLGRDATPLLVSRMLSGPIEARWAAVSAEAELRDPRALATLGEVAIRDAYPPLRFEAQRALGEYEDPTSAFDVMRRAVASETEAPGVRWNAAFTLAMFGLDDGLDLLHAGAHAPDPIVRWQALEALRLVHDDDTVRILAPLLVSPEEGDRQELVLTLGRIGGPAAFLMLVGALGDGDPGVRWRASMVLGSFGNVRAIPPLRRLLAKELDPQVIRHAQKALTQLEALL